MSRYGYLTCHTCEISLWVGKALFSNGRVVAFHIGPDEAPSNSKNERLNRALWKFLAEHTGHHIATLVEGDLDFDRIGEYREIGGDMDGDLTLDEYVRDFSG
jgi:hypothetical protein